MKSHYRFSRLGITALLRLWRGDSPRTMHRASCCRNPLVRRRGQRLLVPGLGVAWLLAAPAWLEASTDKLPPGYSIKLVSSGPVSSHPSQLAFQPGNLTQLFVARVFQYKISRYDYDPVTGMLSNEVTVASDPNQKPVIGLGFHGPDLYATFHYAGSPTVRPGDGRIARFTQPDAHGVYQVRHDFVHGVNVGDHQLNQIQIQGDSLYVGIGAVGANGNPAIENLYTMTIARVVDLKQVVTDPAEIGPDFKGPVNYLASPTEWTNTAGADGQLRYFASGFRNPFGIAFDPDGELWVSSNGNNHPGYVSDDLLFKNVRLGDQGDFPPPEFGFDTYITGTPLEPFANFGVSPSPTGFDFITDGPDAGKILMASAGGAPADLGRDLVLIDGETGEWEQIYQFSTNAPVSIMTDVVRDPFGRFLLSDFVRGDIWLLTPPRPQPRLTARLTNAVLQLSWPLTGVEYRLEETSDPAMADSWQPSAATVQIKTTGIETELAVTSAARFFRLRK